MTDNNKERILVEIKKLNQIRDEIGPKKVQHTCGSSCLSLAIQSFNQGFDASTEYWQARTSKLIEALAFYSDEGNYTHDDDGNHLA